jgi:hypothetical protein
MQAIREPLFGERTSLRALILTFALAFGQLYSNLVPSDVECEDHYGPELEGHMLANDGKRIEMALQKITPKFAKWYPYAAYAPSCMLVLFMVYAEFMVLKAKDRAGIA